MHTDDAMDMDRAIKQLSGSRRGANAMRRVLEWLDDDGLGLDDYNQEAIVSLLWLAWRWPSSTRDAMREAVDTKANV